MRHEKNTTNLRKEGPMLRRKSDTCRLAKLAAELGKALTARARCSMLRDEHIELLDVGS